MITSKILSNKIPIYTHEELAEISRRASSSAKFSATQVQEILTILGRTYEGEFSVSYNKIFKTATLFYYNQSFHEFQLK